MFVVFVPVLLFCEGNKGMISSSFSKTLPLLYVFVLSSFRFEELSNHFPREKSVTPLPLPMFVLLLRC
jgi:hypothetical protein